MSIVTPPSPGTSGNGTTAVSADKIHVLLVDDSVVVRGFIGRLLESDPDIKVIASVADGAQGVEAVAKHHPDIVILDIEMPVMDGITALPKILAASPGVRVLMCSTLTLGNAEISMKALRLGATDYIPKPSNSSDIYGASDFKTELLGKVKALGHRASLPPGARAGASSPASPVSSAAIAAKATQFVGGQGGVLKSKTPYTLRPHPPGELFHPHVLAIGSSTGGPQALFKFVSSLKGVPIPMILTQHMPATFTKILAQHITQQTGVTALEGENGMIVENGKLYVAPGGHHMTFTRRDGRVEIVLNDGPPENFCRPSVDPMLRSAINVWGPKILTVILTGMGSDGLPGGKLVVEGGGRIVAQDQETSVVWGMPGAVATNGLCTAVLPLPDIGPWVRQALGLSRI